jgi:glycosyltransferase involved in cell wall biosynthesis
MLSQDIKKNGKQLVSVCIPSYNSAKYLNTSIKSVLAQTYDNFELVIVDNDSKDNTPEIVSSFHDERIKYIKNPKTVPMAENWNVCLRLAKGKYVSILHADDALLPGMLENGVLVMENNDDVGYVYSGVNIINENGDIVSSVLPYPDNSIKDGSQQFSSHILGNYFYCPSVLVRKKCYETAGYFDPTIANAADWDMWLRIELASYRVAYTAKILANYRIHGGSETSTSKFLGSNKEMAETYGIIRKYLTSEELDRVFSKQRARSIKDRALLSYFSLFLKKMTIRFFRTRDFGAYMKDIKFLFMSLFSGGELHLSFFSPFELASMLIFKARRALSK